MTSVKLSLHPSGPSAAFRLSGLHPWDFLFPTDLSSHILWFCFQKSTFLPTWGRLVLGVREGLLCPYSAGSSFSVVSALCTAWIVYCFLLWAWLHPCDLVMWLAVTNVSVMSLQMSVLFSENTLSFFLSEKILKRIPCLWFFTVVDFFLTCGKFKMF